MIISDEIKQFRRGLETAAELFSHYNGSTQYVGVTGGTMQEFMSEVNAGLHDWHAIQTDVVLGTPKADEIARAVKKGNGK